MKKIFFILFFSIFSFQLFSQHDTANTAKTGATKIKSGTTVRAVIRGNDTIPVVNLPAFRIFSDRIFKNSREEKKYGRLKKDVMKVYPYAKLAGVKLRHYNDTLEKIPTEKMRRKFLKQIERELKDEFTDDVEDMTVNQGRILIRLIDRETGNTSYHLVEELRGTFSAFFWQSIARLFGHNLKSKYNPREGEDKIIEEIVLLIESGEMK